MKFTWESENMLWSLYLSLDRGGVYVALTLWGIDIEFHILNLRKEIIGEIEKNEAPNPNDDEMTPEAINRAYFVCPKCNQLSEKHPVKEGLVMCTQCGTLIKE